MRFASVILDIPTQALDAPYTYSVPEAPAEAGGYDVEVGCAVLVPFGHRQAVGFVVGLQELPDGEAPAGIDVAKVKPVARAVSPAYFDEEGAACAQWLSERYLAPLSSCVRLFTPPGGVPRMVRAQEGYWRLEEPAVGEVDDRWVVPGEAFDGFEPRKNAVKQASIVEALRAGELRVAELAAEFGAVSGALKALEKQGVVRIERRRRMRGFQVPTACQPPEPAAAAAGRGTRSRGDAGGSRTEVRFASAIPTISGTTDGLADLLRQPASSSSHLRREGALCERPDQPAVAQPAFRKLCGISLEAHAGGVCVGIGVNVEPPDAVDAAAVGGKNVPVYLPELGFEGNVDDVAAAVLHAFAPLYRAWLAEGFAPLAGEYAAHASLTGRSVRMVNRAGEPVAEGTVASVDAFGRLVLRASDGSRVPVASGEAHLV